MNDDEETMTLHQTSTPALRRPAQRRDKQRLWQDLALLAPSFLLLSLFLLPPFLFSFFPSLPP
ncbi:sugar ABC transporter permease, partial [Rhizobium leguminosarum]